MSNGGWGKTHLYTQKRINWKILKLNKKILYLKKIIFLKGIGKASTL